MRLAGNVIYADHGLHGVIVPLKITSTKTLKKLFVNYLIQANSPDY